MRRPVISLLVLAAVALAAPTGAGAFLYSGEGKWVPGSLLIKFNTTDRSKITKFVDAIRGEVKHRLPLIEGGYEIRVEGSIETAIDRAFELSHNPEKARAFGVPRSVKVEWAQPNYNLHLNLFATPKQKDYWPNDPGYWPNKYTNPFHCADQPTGIGQVGLWPLDANLRSTVGDWNTAQANPLSPVNRLPTVSSSFGLAGTAQSSINVLPVWNALAESFGDGRRTVGATGPGEDLIWRLADLQRSGIAVIDSGISSAPDLIRQVYGLISVGRQQTAQPATEFSQEHLTYVYNNPLDPRDEVEAVTKELEGIAIQQHFQRPLVPFDDLGRNFDPGAKPDFVGSGCDGHGSQVASVAAATANNSLGITGVGWNVPVLAIRHAVPALDGPLEARELRNPENLLDRYRSARPVRFTDTSLIDALAIVKALHVPVLNMSWGAQLFATGIKPHDGALIVTSPAVVEAMGRLLSDNVTLGVAAAGPGRYGVGAGARGASTTLGAATADQLPCGLRTLGALAPKVLAGDLNPQAFDPGINWNRLNLLCVTGTYADSEKLIPEAGGGESAVDLAAPGVAVVAGRPVGPTLNHAGPIEPTPTYKLGTGTSFAAAMVSGAAALLREVAPEAKAPVIMKALRAGASSDIRLRTSVRYGHLDVACAALWLAQNIDSLHNEGRSRVSPNQLEGPYTGRCFSPRSIYRRYEWKLPTSYFDKTSRTDAADGVSLGGEPRRWAASQLPGVVIGAQNAGTARSAQTEQLEGLNVRWPFSKSAFFPIGRGNPFLDPQEIAADRPVYYFGGQKVACPAGSGLVDMNAGWKDAIHPQGYLMFSQRFGLASATMLVVLVKPWYEGFLSNPMRMVVKIRCAVVPPGADLEGQASGDAH